MMRHDETRWRVVLLNFKPLGPLCCFLTNTRISSVIRIDEEEIGKHNTNDHENEVPRLEVVANLGNDVRDGDIKEGSGGEREGHGHHRRANLRDPQSGERREKGGDGGRGGEQSDVGVRYMQRNERNVHFLAVRPSFLK